MTIRFDSIHSFGAIQELVGELEMKRREDDTEV
jgi:hypothetical protein